METDGTIYLVRHGETEWNREGRIQGHLDSPLTKRGEDQARRVGGLLAELIPEPTHRVVTVSPLGRTRSTAAIVCERLGLDPAGCRIDELLIEITLEKWDGMTSGEIAATDAETWRLYRNDHWNFVPPDGESYAMMADRARRWLSATAIARSNLIVVSHGAFGRVLRGVYTGLGPEQTLAQEEPQDLIFRLSGGSIARIEA